MIGKRSHFSISKFVPQNVFLNYGAIGLTGQQLEAEWTYVSHLSQKPSEKPSLEWP